MKNFITKILCNDKFEKFILSLIVLNLIIFVLDSMSTFHAQFSDFVAWFEFVSIIIFTVEYCLRVLTIEHFKDLFKPMMLVDFFAVVPYYLSFVTVNTVFIRILRLSRLVRIAKIGRYSAALDNIIKAFKDKKEELIITFSIFGIGVLITAILMYIAENEVQPHVFSSVPKCFYFSIITFTTIGYGDVTPVTVFGKTISCISAILGVGLHGLFIGIIGTAFMNAFRRNDAE